MATNLGSALSNISGYPKAPVQKKKPTVQTPQQSFNADGNIVTTAKNGTAIQPSRPYWTAKGYQQQPQQTNIGRAVDTSRQFGAASADPTQGFQASSIPTATELSAQTPEPRYVFSGGKKYLVGPNGQTTEVTQQDRRRDIATRQPQQTTQQFQTATAAVSPETDPYVSDYDKQQQQRDRIPDFWNDLGFTPEWIYDEQWHDVPWDRDMWWPGKLQGESPPKWMEKTADPNHPFASFDWTGSQTGTEPDARTKAAAKEYEVRLEGFEAAKDPSGSVRDGVVYFGPVATMSVQEYADKYNMSVAEVTNAFSEYTPTGGDPTVPTDPTAPTGPSPPTGPRNIPDATIDQLPPGSTDARSFYDQLFNLNPAVGPEADQAFYDAQIARINRNLGEAGDVISDDINFRAENQGVFSSLDKEALLARENRELQEAGFIEKNLAAEQFTYTGLERERLRNETNLRTATDWANLDRQERSDVMDFTLGKYKTDVDKMFQSGQLDLGWFNAKVAKNLGISEQELKARGYDLQAFGLTIDEMLANAKVENDYLQVQAMLEQAAQQMDLAQNQALNDWIRNVLGDTLNVFTGGGA